MQNKIKLDNIQKFCLYHVVIKNRIKFKFNKIILACNLLNVLKTHFFECDSKAETEIHSLVCHKHLYMYLLAIKSFLRFYNNISVVAHDDGTLNTKDKKILMQHIRDIKIVDKNFADKKLNKILKYFPNSKKYRNTFPNAKQLFDFIQFSKSKKIIFLDSDTLFFGKPKKVIDWISTKNKDIIYLYEKISSSKKELASKKYSNLSHLCIGFMCIYKEIIDLKLIEKILGKIKKYNWWTGQDIFAILMKNNFNKFNISYFGINKYQDRSFFNSNKVLFRHYWSSFNICNEYVKDTKKIIAKLI